MEAQVNLGDKGGRQSKVNGERKDKKRVCSLKGGRAENVSAASLMTAS